MRNFLKTLGCWNVLLEHGTSETKPWQLCNHRSCKYLKKSVLMVMWLLEEKELRYQNTHSWEQKQDRHEEIDEGLSSAFKNIKLWQLSRATKSLRTQLHMPRKSLTCSYIAYKHAQHWELLPLCYSQQKPFCSPLSSFCWPPMATPGQDHCVYVLHPPQWPSTSLSSILFIKSPESQPPWSLQVPHASWLCLLLTQDKQSLKCEGTTHLH